MRETVEARLGPPPGPPPPRFGTASTCSLPFSTLGPPVGVPGATVVAVDGTVEPGVCGVPPSCAAGTPV